MEIVVKVGEEIDKRKVETMSPGILMATAWIKKEKPRHNARGLT